MKIEAVTALADNFMYLLIDSATKTCALVDPVECSTALAAAAKHGVTVTHVLTTHHHWDHAGGNNDVAKAIPGVSICGFDNRVGSLSAPVKHGDVVEVGNLKVKCLHTPCHTSGHICYFVESGPQDAAVFTGDTLFIAGCGKFFEGDAKQMHTALIEILGTLPPHTKVYCGHEYTVNNLKFAESVEPKNMDIKNKAVWAQDKRKANLATVPSTIGDEFKYNPFMRVREPSVQASMNTKNPIDTMAALRNAKNNFR